MKKLIGLVIIATLVGCDIKVAQSKREHEAAAQAAQEKAESDSRSVKSESASLVHYINTQRALLEGECADAEKAREKLQETRRTYSARLAVLTATNKANVVEARMETLLATLKDGQVNEIARKFLGRDFTVIASDLEMRYRAAQQEAVQRRKKLAQNEAEYKTRVASANERAQQVRQNAQRAIADAEREIARLESRRKSLMSETLVSTVRKQRIREELSEVDNRLRQLRNRRDSNVMAAQNDQREKSAVQAAQGEVQWAARMKKEADKEIAAVVDDVGKLILETSDKTVKALDLALAEKDVDLAEIIADRRKKIAFLSASMKGLEALDLGGLRDVRKQVESELSKTPKKTKK